MKKTALFVATAITLCTSCHEFSTKIQGLMALKGKIQQKYNVKNVSINIRKDEEKSYLKVSLLNTPYIDSPEMVKQNIADSIGVLCTTGMPSIKFTKGSVAFGEETSMGAVKTSGSQEYDMHLAR